MDCVARFWTHVNHDDWFGCWPWLIATNEKGYGVYGITRTDTRLAHRFSYEVSVGPIPDGMCVLHRCDNPTCVRPSHLFLGTRADNMRDCISKGRVSKGAKHSTFVRHGESHPRAKLTEDKVREMRLEYRGPHKKPTLKELSIRYGVSLPQVYSVVNRLVWAHVA